MGRAAVELFLITRSEHSFEECESHAISLLGPFLGHIFRALDNEQNTVSVLKEVSKF